MKVTVKEEYPNVFSELAVGEVFILPLIGKENKICIKIGKSFRGDESFLDVKTGELHNIAPDCTVKRVEAELIIHTALSKASS